MTDERRKELARLGYPENPRNLLKMRLWEELNLRDPLDRKCPYTGAQINIEKLLSEEVDIDHLLPFKASLDDSAANKIMATGKRSFEYGMPQPTEKEREWAIKVAKVIVRMVRDHKGSKAEIESQVARELYCSVAVLNAGN